MAHRKPHDLWRSGGRPGHRRQDCQCPSWPSGQAGERHRVAIDHDRTDIGTEFLDSVKIAIFVAVFLALLLLARRLSSSETAIIPGPPDPPEPHPPDDGPRPTVRAMDPNSPRRSALTGADLPFPVPPPPVKRGKDGRYNRPNILNYFFKTIDLVQGPPDSRSFCDAFLIEIQNPGDGNAWTLQYIVATPTGLQKELDAEASSSLYFENGVIIVPKWDLNGILQTVVEEILKHWGDADEEPGDAAPIA